MKEIRSSPPEPLDFTVYRSREEPAGVSLPDDVRRQSWTSTRRGFGFMNRSVVRPVYGCDPLHENAFHVHCNRWPGPYMGGGRVMVFSPAGHKLFDGSDGGE